MSSSGERLPVVIRALRPRDLPGLIRMRHGGVHLDLPETLFGAYTPLKGVAQNRWLPLQRGRVRTYLARTNLARANDVLAAFVQARERPAGHKWDILHLGAAPEGGSVAPSRRVDLWTALLDYTTAAAGRRNIQRLYAKLPGGAEGSEAFRAAGYGRYGEEMVYLLYGHRYRQHRGADRLPRAEEVGGTPRGAPRPRPQLPSDTWALHQLYNWTAPKPAQHAEAYTSHRWELPKRWDLGRVRGGPREWGFIVERGHEIAVYCRVGRQGRRSRLEFVFDPQSRELLGPALEAVLRWLAPGGSERVYCTVREFQGELGAVLEGQGFEPLGVQDLLVRYTTVTAPLRAPLSYSWPALEKRPVGIPARLSLQRQGQRGGGRWDEVEEPAGTPAQTALAMASWRAAAAAAGVRPGCE